MPRTYSEIRDLVLQTLIDAGIDPGGSANEVFATAELDAFIPDAVTEVSRYRPRMVKDTSLTATANLWNVTLSSEIRRNLIRIVALEYNAQSGQDPTRCRRNFTQFASRAEVETGQRPRPAGKASICTCTRSTCWSMWGRPIWPGRQRLWRRSEQRPSC